MSVVIPRIPQLLPPCGIYYIVKTVKYDRAARAFTYQEFNASRNSYLYITIHKIAITNFLFLLRFLNGMCTNEVGT